MEIECINCDTEMKIILTQGYCKDDGSFEIKSQKTIKKKFNYRIVLNARKKDYYQEKVIALTASDKEINELANSKIYMTLEKQPVIIAGTIVNYCDNKVIPNNLVRLQFLNLDMEFTI